MSDPPVATGLDDSGDRQLLVARQEATDGEDEPGQRAVIQLGCAFAADHFPALR